MTGNLSSISLPALNNFLLVVVPGGITSESEGDFSVSFSVALTVLFAKSMTEQTEIISSSVSLIRLINDT